MNTTIPSLEGPDGYATPKLDEQARQRTSDEGADAVCQVDVSAVDWTPPAEFGKVRALFIATGGTIYVDAPRYGTNVPFKVQDGQELHVRASKVYHTGTTATDIVALG